MLKKTYIALFLILIFNLWIKGQQNLSGRQIGIIESKIVTVLNSYEKYSNLDENTYNTQKNLNELQKIFGIHAQIFNYLDPDAFKTSPISSGEFLNFYRSNFSTGLSVKLIWNIKKTFYQKNPDDNNYLAIIPVEIKALGIQNTRRIINISENTWFIFSFNMTGSEISNFKLSSIQQNKPKIHVVKETRNYVSFHCSPMMSYIYSKNIYSDPYWNATGKFGFELGLDLNYKLSKNLFLITGLGLSNYKSTYSLKNFESRNLTEPIMLTDLDDDRYLALISADINEKNSLNLLDIPIGVKYHFDIGNLKFILRGGLNISYNISSKYEISGSSVLEGYYTKYHVVLSNIDRYYFTSEELSGNHKWELNPVNVSAFISFGIQFPLGEKTLLNISPCFVNGLSDLGYTKPKYIHDYYNIYGDPGKLITRGFGLRFELLWKM